VPANLVTSYYQVLEPTTLPRKAKTIVATVAEGETTARRVSASALAAVGSGGWDFESVSEAELHLGQRHGLVRACIFRDTGVAHQPSRHDDVVDALTG
jgi:hypothetical protein